MVMNDDDNNDEDNDDIHDDDSDDNDDIHDDNSDDDSDIKSVPWGVEVESSIERSRLISIDKERWYIERYIDI